MGAVKEALKKSLKKDTVDVNGVSIPLLRPEYDAAADLRRDIFSADGPKNFEKMSQSEAIGVGQKLLVASLRLCISEIESDAEAKELIMAAGGDNSDLAVKCSKMCGWYSKQQMGVRGFDQDLPS